MQKNTQSMLPLSLYIHIPWCIKKCPYCDFNSHEGKKDNITLLERAYIKQLICDLDAHLPDIENCAIETIFIGGGTPSLLSADAYAQLLDAIAKRCHLSSDVEITLEANPGTLEANRFLAYRHVGINRLSLGVQSFNDNALCKLGRIHNVMQAQDAIISAKQAGFARINIDIMYGLPMQSIEAALFDLQCAIDAGVEHISWYQLTIEPNTFFYRYPPNLPKEDCIIEIEQAGIALLNQAGFKRYEISAYCRNDAVCQHNVNYWRYGDYLGLGAGAHSKLTDTKTGAIRRCWKTKQPANYLDPNKAFIVANQTINPEEQIFEFMLNVLRLFSPTDFSLFERRTQLTLADIMPLLIRAKQHGWLNYDMHQFCPTELGHRYLNNLVALFLP